MEPGEPLRTPHFLWKENMIRSHVVKRMNVKTKRRVFTVLREEGTDEHTFIPSVGLTIGEFSVFHVFIE